MCHFRLQFEEIPILDQVENIQQYILFAAKDNAKQRELLYHLFIIEEFIKEDKQKRADELKDVDWEKYIYQIGPDNPSNNFLLDLPINKRKK